MVKNCRNNMIIQKSIQQKITYNLEIKTNAKMKFQIYANLNKVMTN